MMLWYTIGWMIESDKNHNHYYTPSLIHHALLSPRLGHSEMYNCTASTIPCPCIPWLMDSISRVNRIDNQWLCNCIYWIFDIIIHQNSKWESIIMLAFSFSFQFHSILVILFFFNFVQFLPFCFFRFWFLIMKDL